MIPKNEQEQEILERLQKLERETFGATAEMNYHRGTGRRDTGRTDKYSDDDPLTDYRQYREDYPQENENARETAQKISDDEIPNQHIGKYVMETLVQEIKSLGRTSMNFRGKKWNAKFRTMSTNLARARSDLSEKDFNQLLLQMNEIIGGKVLR